MQGVQDDFPVLSKMVRGSKDLPENLSPFTDLLELSRPFDLILLLDGRFRHARLSSRGLIERKEKDDCELLFC